MGENEEQVNHNSDEDTPFVVRYVSKESFPKRCFFGLWKCFLCSSSSLFWFLSVILLILFFVTLAFFYSVSTWYQPDLTIQTVDVNWQTETFVKNSIGESEVLYYILQLGGLPSNSTNDVTSINLCILADNTEISAYIRSEFPSLPNANVPQSDSFWESSDWEDDQHELFYKSEQIPSCSSGTLLLNYRNCHDLPIYITVIREAQKSSKQLSFSISLYYDYCTNNNEYSSYEKCSCGVDDAPYVYTSLVYLTAILLFILVACFFCVSFCFVKSLQRRCRSKERVFVSS